MKRRWAPQTRYTFQRKTASMLKDLIWKTNPGLYYLHEIFKSIKSEYNSVFANIM